MTCNPHSEARAREVLASALEAIGYRKTAADVRASAQGATAFGDTVIRAMLAFAETPAPPSTASSERALREALFWELRRAWFAGRESPRRYDSEAVEAEWETQIKRLIAALSTKAPAEQGDEA